MTMPLRYIPRIDIKGFHAVKGVQLEGLRVVGDPHDLALKYYEQGADELIFMDIVASLYNRKIKSDVLIRAVKDIFIPIIIGGGIRTLDDASHLFRIGADKVAVNTAAIKRPQLLKEISNHFGAQSLVLSVEAKKQGSIWEAYINNGRDKTGLNIVDWIAYAETLGVGEILLTSIDYEGTLSSLDFELIETISPLVSVPLMICGGLGEPNQLTPLIQKAKIDAVVLSSLLHYNRCKISDLKVI